MQIQRRYAGSSAAPSEQSASSAAMVDGMQAGDEVRNASFACTTGAITAHRC